MKHIFRIAMVMGLITLAACETRPADPRAKPALRSVETAADQRYIACVARDPFFKSTECKDARDRLGTRGGR